MKLDHGPARRRARVEMIPLIDCVFILLVFFIYSMLAMTLQRGIVVQLPEARTLQASQEEAVVVTITATGEVLVNKEEVAIDGLGPAMDNVLSGLEQPRVVVNADAGSQHRWFVRVIDELKAQGVNQIVILSEEPSPP
jgi:biopolymer transport protein ExbD